NPTPTAEARSPGITPSSCSATAPWNYTCSMNECTLNYDNCDSSPEACVETYTFFCSCPTGYTGTGVGSSGCLNITECSNGNPCLEDTFPAVNACIELTPRYDCSCGFGFSLASDGTYSETCANVDECTMGNPCLESV